MNYRHAYHAGNFADVLKHTALVALLQHLLKKDKPFAVIDTHAGRGLYDLGGEEAAKTEEAESGIARLHDLSNASEIFARYLKIVRSQDSKHYPGSPLITASMLRPQDRLVAIEKHPEEFAELSKPLRPFANAQAVEGDGYEKLKALLPPPERRGLILVDPPYERDDEFVEAARALIAAHRRFATGIYVWWYPVKSDADTNAAIGEVLNAGIHKVLRLELDVGQLRERPDQLHTAGLVVINPPFEFDVEMCGVVEILAKKLKQGEGAIGRLEWLAGEGTRS